MDVGGADQRAAQLPGDPHDALVGLPLVGDAVALKLEVDVLGAEYPDELVGVRAGVGGLVVDDSPAHSGLQAAGEGDHALRMAVEELGVDRGLAAVEALEETGRRQLDQIAKALVGARQKRQVVALPRAAQGAIVDVVGLQAEDGLDPRLLAGLVVLDRAVHHAVVGEAEGGHLELSRALGESGDLAGSVQERVLTVDVKMDRRRAHLTIMATGPDATAVVFRRLREWSVRQPAGSP